MLLELEIGVGNPITDKWQVSIQGIIGEKAQFFCEVTWNSPLVACERCCPASSRKAHASMDTTFAPQKNHIPSAEEHAQS